MQIHRNFHLVGLGLFLLLCNNFAIAATPQTKTVTCGGADKNQKQEQKGLIRAKRDNSTWVYSLVAGGNLKLKDVVWSYPGKGAAASGWGGTTESVVQGEKHYRMAWTSPLTTDVVANTGNFKVTVSGKRVCPGGSNGPGPAGEVETFEITWDTDVIGIKIKRGAVDVTEPQVNPQSVKVGQVINLTAELEGVPAGAVVTLPEWTIPDIYYERWDEDGTAPVMPEVAANAINFYWVDGGLGKSVTYAITVNGERLAPATAKFDVDRPTYTFTVTNTGTIAVGPGVGYPGVNEGEDDAGSTYLHYGVPHTAAAGITFSTDPPRPADNVANPVLRLAQLATSIDRRVRVGDTWGKWNKTSGLDAYPAGLNDSPGQGVLATDELRFNDAFKTWLLYRPPGVANAQWVPLKVVSWSWAATAKKQGGVWVNSTVAGEGSLMSATTATTTPGAATNEYPLWTQRIFPGEWHVIPAPAD